MMAGSSAGRRRSSRCFDQRDAHCTENRSMPQTLKERRLSAAWLIAPGALTLAGLLFAPLLNLFHQSLQPFVSGQVGAAADTGYTLQNYRDLLRPAYFLYIADTFRISLLAAL